MNAVGAKKKVSSYWWLALICLCLVPCAVPLACNGDPRAIANGIPPGCRISDLDQHLGNFYDDSEVTVWSTAKTAETSDKAKVTGYGLFYERTIGSYPWWVDTEPDRDAFTGELRFWHHSWVIPDDLAPSYELSLVFVNGVLKKKHYGYLPG